MDAIEEFWYWWTHDSEGNFLPIVDYPVWDEEEKEEVEEDGSE